MPDDSHTERKIRETWQVAHEKLHELEREDLRVAREEINRRLNEMNELRSQISSERGMFVTRDMHDRNIGLIREAVDSRLNTIEKQMANWQGKLWMMGAVIGVAATLVAVIINIILYFLKG